MNTSKGLVPGASDTVVIVLAYVLCHGITAWIVNPVQAYFLGDITIFASLLYLPHGVRVLSIWLCGWRALLPLMMAALLSEFLFTEAHVLELTSYALWLSVPVGALSAYLAFELFHLFGHSVYAGQSRRMDWRQLMLVGVLASVFNSIGQTIVFAGVISPGDQMSVVVTYALGDMIGQAVTMIGLMMVFRSVRRLAERS
ncbi:hypothetical protein [Phaeobacter sp. B1627]|uniref:hypothetical protein n=1 Tax=Phaeobacter sp. B1627 TaxID=2583809 RepID=UPI00111BA381|nr:hypothetical protein [Phaeobacter sp. B1627]TNJ48457.1 hypothetical protein FGE21_00475 [Phaeobacter sp. B1627]